MTYRGIVTNGIVVIEGDKPDDGTVVEVTPIEQVASPPQENEFAKHPAIGIWKDRTDLPPDAAEAASTLSRKLMRHADE